MLQNQETGTILHHWRDGGHGEALAPRPRPVVTPQRGRMVRSADPPALFFLSRTASRMDEERKAEAWSQQPEARN